MPSRLLALRALVAFVLVGLVTSECHRARHINGVTTAYCTDEDTGEEFEFDEYGGRHVFQGHATPRMLRAIYADYLNGTSNRPPSTNTISGVTKSKRDEGKGHWVECNHLSEGVCFDDDSIFWLSSPEEFQARLRWMFMGRISGERMNQEPKTICTQWAGGGKICVQWVFKVKKKILEATAVHAAAGHLHGCQSRHFSGEIKMQMNDGTYQFFCVSGRGNECKVNMDINVCPNLKYVNPPF